MTKSFNWFAGNAPLTRPNSFPFQKYAKVGIDLMLYLAPNICSRAMKVFRTMDYLILVHLKERHHSKSFYQLCQHMEPDYHQLEFDCRVYLTWKNG